MLQQDAGEQSHTAHASTSLKVSMQLDLILKKIVVSHLFNMIWPSSADPVSVGGGGRVPFLIIIHANVLYVFMFAPFFPLPPPFTGRYGISVGKTTYTSFPQALGIKIHINQLIITLCRSLATSENALRFVVIHSTVEFRKVSFLSKFKLEIVSLRLIPS